jgi:hypothetical protein
MRFLIAGLLSVAFVAAPIAKADAAKTSKRHPNHCDDYCQRYPSANSRQLKNAKAYDQGEYWEQDPNAHPFGSPGWWYLKERDRRGRLPF